MPLVMNTCMEPTSIWITRTQAVGLFGLHATGEIQRWATSLDNNLVNHEGESFEEDTGYFQHEMREEVANALELLGAT